MNASNSAKYLELLYSSDAMKQTCRAGFTLIEVMVVIAIIAILALMAVPTFIEKIVRDQIVEALPLADIVKPPVAAAWQLGLPLPTDNAAAALPPPDKIVNNFVKSVALQDGAIHITFGNRASGSIQGKTLTLRPAVVDTAPIVPVTWVCGTANGPNGMSIKGVNLTDIESKYLPIKCRN